MNKFIFSEIAILIEPSPLQDGHQQKTKGINLLYSK